MIYELISITYDGVACKDVSVDKRENEEKKEVVEEDIPSIVLVCVVSVLCCPRFSCVLEKEKVIGLFPESNRGHLYPKQVFYH